VARLHEGTTGGLFRRSTDGGAWEQMTAGLPAETDVHAITVHPTDPEIVYIGTKRGPFRSSNRGATWQAMNFPFPGVQVWSILVHPANPRVMYAGGAPVSVYRSDDAGETWRVLANPNMPERVKMPFPCRVMRLAAHPLDTNVIYATLEVDGVMRTLDGGESWQDCSSDLISLAERPNLTNHLRSTLKAEGMLDGHAIEVSAAEPDTVFVAVRMGLFRSTDRGTEWSDMEIGRFSPLRYGRDVRVSPLDPKVMYACLSPASRSRDGSLYRSSDIGRSWERFDHTIQARATMMAVALHPTDPAQVYCTARLGQVFGTADAGRTWQEFPLPEPCQDVFCLACG
jgi:photosystem II stability/assembly factor-like uncharacterized protein